MADTSLYKKTALLNIVVAGHYSGVFGLGRLASDVDRATLTAAQKARRNLAVLSDVAMVPGLAAAGIVYDALKQSANFDKLTQHVRGQTNITTTQLAQMRTQTLGFLKDYGQAINDTSDAYRRAYNSQNQFFYHKKGMTNAQATAMQAKDAQAVVREAVKASYGTGDPAAGIANTIGAALYAYNRQASAKVGKLTNAQIVTAELHTGAADTNLRLGEFAKDLSGVLPQAKNLGISLAQLGGMMATLTKGGITGPQAQTQIRGLLTQIQRPTPLAQRNLETVSNQTGIDLVHAFSASGIKSMGLPAVFQKLREALRRERQLGRDPTDVLSGIITQRRGLTGIFNLLSDQGVKTQEQTTREMAMSGQGRYKNAQGQWVDAGWATNEQGQRFHRTVTDVMSDAYKSSLPGQEAILKGSWLKLMIDLGHTVTGPALSLLKPLIGMVQGLDKWLTTAGNAQKAQNFIKIALAVGAIGGGLRIAIGAFEVLNKLASANPYLIAITAGVVLYTKWKPFHDLVNGVASTIWKITQALASFGSAHPTLLKTGLIIGGLVIVGFAITRILASVVRGFMSVSKAAKAASHNPFTFAYAKDASSWIGRLATGVSKESKEAELAEKTNKKLADAKGLLGTNAKAAAAQLERLGVQVKKEGYQPDQAKLDQMNKNKNRLATLINEDPRAGARFQAQRTARDDEIAQLRKELAIEHEILAKEEKQYQLAIKTAKEQALAADKALKDAQKKAAMVQRTADKQLVADQKKAERQAAADKRTADRLAMKSQKAQARADLESQKHAQRQAIQAQRVIDRQVLIDKKVQEKQAADVKRADAQRGQGLVSQPIVSKLESILNHMGTLSTVLSNISTASITTNDLLREIVAVLRNGNYGMGSGGHGTPETIIPHERSSQLVLPSSMLPPGYTRGRSTLETLSPNTSHLEVLPSGHSQASPSDNFVRKVVVAERHGTESIKNPMGDRMLLVARGQGKEVGLGHLPRLGPDATLEMERMAAGGATQEALNEFYHSSARSGGMLPADLTTGRAFGAKVGPSGIRTTSKLHIGHLLRSDWMPTSWTERKFKRKKGFTGGFHILSPSYNADILNRKLSPFMAMQEGGINREVERNNQTPFGVLPWEKTLSVSEKAANYRATTQEKYGRPSEWLPFTHDDVYSQMAGHAGIAQLDSHTKGVEGSRPIDAIRKLNTDRYTMQRSMLESKDSPVFAHEIDSIINSLFEEVITTKGLDAEKELAHAHSQLNSKERKALDTGVKEYLGADANTRTLLSARNLRRMDPTLSRAEAKANSEAQLARLNEGVNVESDARLNKLIALKNHPEAFRELNQILAGVETYGKELPAKMDVIGSEIVTRLSEGAAQLQPLMRDTGELLITKEGGFLRSIEPGSPTVSGRNYGTIGENIVTQMNLGLKRMIETLRLTGEELAQAIVNPLKDAALTIGTQGTKLVDRYGSAITSEKDVAIIASTEVATKTSQALKPQPLVTTNGKATGVAFAGGVDSGTSLAAVDTAASNVMTRTIRMTRPRRRAENTNGTLSTVAFASGIDSPAALRAVDLAANKVGMHSKTHMESAFLGVPVGAGGLGRDRHGNVTEVDENGHPVSRSRMRRFGAALGRGGTGALMMGGMIAGMVGSQFIPTVQVPGSKDPNSMTNQVANMVLQMVAMSVVPAILGAAGRGIWRGGKGLFGEGKPGVPTSSTSTADEVEQFLKNTGNSGGSKLVLGRLLQSVLLPTLVLSLPLIAAALLIKGKPAPKVTGDKVTPMNRQAAFYEAERRWGSGVVNTNPELYINKVLAEHGVKTDNQKIGTGGPADPTKGGMGMLVHNMLGRINQARASRSGSALDHSGRHSLAFSMKDAEKAAGTRDRNVIADVDYAWKIANQEYLNNQKDLAIAAKKRSDFWKNLTSSHLLTKKESSQFGNIWKTLSSGEQDKLTKQGVAATISSMQHGNQVSTLGNLNKIFGSNKSNDQVVKDSGKHAGVKWMQGWSEATGQKQIARGILQSIQEHLDPSLKKVDPAKWGWKFVEEYYKALDKGIPNFKGASSRLINTIINELMFASPNKSGSFNPQKSAENMVGSMYKSFTTTGVNQFKTAAALLMSTLKDWLSFDSSGKNSKGDNFTTSGQNLILGLIKGMGNKLSELDTKAQSTGKSISSHIGKGGAFVKLGDNIMKWTVSGIQSYIDGNQSGLNAIGQALAQAMGAGANSSGANGGPYGLGGGGNLAAIFGVNGTFSGLGQTLSGTVANDDSAGISFSQSLARKFGINTKNDNFANDMDFAGSPGQSVFLPGGKGNKYTYLGNDKGAWGNLLQFATPGGGVVNLPHLMNVANLRAGQSYGGGTNIGQIGDGKGIDSKYWTGPHLALIMDQAAQKYFSGIMPGLLAGGVGGDVGSILSKFRSPISLASRQTGLPANVIASIIQQESSGKVNVRDTAGADGADIGLMQFGPAEAKLAGGAYTHSVGGNIMTGSKYLSYLLKGPAKGNMRTAIAMYNGGPGNPNYRYADQVLGRIVTGMGGGGSNPLGMGGGGSPGGDPATAGQESDPFAPMKEKPAPGIHYTPWGSSPRNFNPRTGQGQYDTSQSRLGYYAARGFVANLETGHSASDIVNNPALWAKYSAGVRNMYSHWADVQIAAQNTVIHRAGGGDPTKYAAAVAGINAIANQKAETALNSIRLKGVKEQFQIAQQQYKIAHDTWSLYTQIGGKKGVNWGMLFSGMTNQQASKFVQPALAAGDAEAAARHKATIASIDAREIRYRINHGSESPEMKAAFTAMRTGADFNYRAEKANNTNNLQQQFWKGRVWAMEHTQTHYVDPQTGKKIDLAPLQFLRQMTAHPNFKTMTDVQRHAWLGREHQLITGQTMEANMGAQAQFAAYSQQVNAGVFGGDKKQRKDMVDYARQNLAETVKLNNQTAIANWQRVQQKASATGTAGSGRVIPVRVIGHCADGSVPGTSARVGATQNPPKPVPPKPTTSHRPTGNQVDHMGTRGGWHHTGPTGSAIDHMGNHHHTQPMAVSGQKVANLSTHIVENGRAQVVQQKRMVGQLGEAVSHLNSMSAKLSSLIALTQEHLHTAKRTASGISPTSSKITTGVHPGPVNQHPHG